MIVTVVIDLLGNGHVHHDGHRVVRECPDGRTCVVLDVLQQRERHALHAGDRVRVVDVIHATVWLQWIRAGGAHCLPLPRSVRQSRWLA
jgi:hypothetical protein